LQLSDAVGRKSHGVTVVRSELCLAILVLGCGVEGGCGGWSWSYGRGARYLVVQWTQIGAYEWADGPVDAARWGL